MMEQYDRITETSLKKKPKKIQQSKQPHQSKKNGGLETKIRRRVALEEKAFRIVERLVDETIDEDNLKQLGQLIEPSNYADITEERSITGLCGYPVCNKQLGKVLSQKYQISTKSNRVYDITERKKFCSDPCYKASKHFAAQISSSPLWLREDQNAVQFTLLPLDGTNRGSVGEDLIFSPTHQISREVQELDQIDKRNERSYKKLGNVLSSKQSSKLAQEDNVTVESLADELTKVYVDLTEKENEGKENKQREENRETEPKHVNATQNVGLISEDCTTDVVVQESTHSQPGSSINEHSLCDDSNSEPSVSNIQSDTIEPCDLGNSQSETVDQTETLQDHDESTSILKGDEPKTETVEFPFNNKTEKDVYGIDNVQKINNMEVCKKTMRPDLPLQNTTSGRDINKSKTGSETRDYDFDYQSRDHVYGLDHAQQILKMKANKELLLSELQQKHINCHSECDFENKTVNNAVFCDETQAERSECVDRKMQSECGEQRVSPDKSSATAVHTVSTATQSKGTLLLQLINKRDELKRKELNSKQNTNLEAQHIVSHQHQTHSDRTSGILQNVQRATEQKCVFESDQSKSRICDSDDDIDDVIEISTNEITNRTLCQSDLNVDSESAKTATSVTKSDKTTIENSGFNEKPKQAMPTNSQTKPKAVKEETVKPKRLSPLILVQNVLFEWKTTESVKYLTSINLSDSAKMSDFEEKYTALGRRLDRAGAEASELLGEIDSDDDDVHTPSGHLPDMRTLERDNYSNYELNVRQFYSTSEDCTKDRLGSQETGKQTTLQTKWEPISERAVVKSLEERTLPEEDAKARRHRKKFFPMKDENEGRFDRSEFVTEPDIVLPTVDSTAQISIRRKIVLEKLSKLLPGLLTPLRLTLHEVSPHIRALVHTFNLTSKNINLKPGEWTIMCLILLKLVASKMEEIERSFELHSALTYFNTITERIGVTEGQIQNIVKKFVR